MSKQGVVVSHLFVTTVKSDRLRPMSRLCLKTLNRFILCRDRDESLEAGDDNVVDGGQGEDGLRSGDQGFVKQERGEGDTIAHEPADTANQAEDDSIEDDDDVREHFAQMTVQTDEYGGLVGNTSPQSVTGGRGGKSMDGLAINYLTGKGGKKDQSDFGLSNVVGELAIDYAKKEWGGGNGSTGIGTGSIGNLGLKLLANGGSDKLGGILMKVLSGRADDDNDSKNLVALLKKYMAEDGGKSLTTVLGRVLASSGGVGNKGTMGRSGGGANVGLASLKGGLSDTLHAFISQDAQKFSSIEPNSGRVPGSLDGNSVFNVGGKDNKIGSIGKVILDNLISGKWKRPVKPYQPSQPQPEPAVAQNFQQIRDECLRNKALFEDPAFPADDASLFYSQASPKRITWMRPGEIVNAPLLFSEGHSRFDVNQGELGDCWLLAGVACLTMNDALFYRVVPPDQSFTENYAGIFHFQFWYYGNWVDVVVDDRLPTENGRLLYMHSRGHAEFWSALLEKAYAKLYGSYEALKGGTTSEALEDFTGGLTEMIDLQAPPPNLVQMLFKAFELGSLMACSIDEDPDVFEAKLSNGLIRGHAYSITGMKMIEETPLIRIRNPWGDQHEWNGAWSDNSPEWNSIPEEQKKSIGLTFAHDGESWIPYDDFMRNFSKVEICNLGPEVMDEVYQMTGVRETKESWKACQQDGEWKGQTAGGCRNFLKTFPNNPQYGISLPEADPKSRDDLCTCIFAVMQKYRREKRKEGLDMLPIGFSVYQVDNIARKNASFLGPNKACARSPVFVNMREICGRFRLPRGNYVIIPSTYEPGQEGQFMVRMFSYAEINVQAL